MRGLILLSLLLASFVYSADNVEVEGLTKAQIAELQIAAEKMKSKEKPEAPITDKAQAYVDMGTMIGKAVASTAKEMNVAVNDFAETPVGRMVFFVVIWKLFGRELMHFIVGSLILAIGVPLWVHFYRRMCIVKSIEYGPGWWLFRSRNVTYRDINLLKGDDKDREDTLKAVMAVILGVLFLASQAAMWTS